MISGNSSLSFKEIAPLHSALSGSLSLSIKWELEE